MQRFHENHGCDVLLSEDRTVAEERDVNDESAHLRTVFSEKHLHPGETFTIKVIEPWIMDVSPKCSVYCFLYKQFYIYI